MSGLMMYVLDIVYGWLVVGMIVWLFVGGVLCVMVEINVDGWCLGLMDGDVGVGMYWLEFGVVDYFCVLGVMLLELLFLDVVGIDFGIVEVGGYYYVLLLVLLFGYLMYWGS